jgi:hypothetical protein
MSMLCTGRWWGRIPCNQFKRSLLALDTRLWGSRSVHLCAGGGGAQPVPSHLLHRTLWATNSPVSFFPVPRHSGHLTKSPGTRTTRCSLHTGQGLMLVMTVPSSASYVPSPPQYPQVFFSRRVRVISLFMSYLRFFWHAPKTVICQKQDTTEK